MPFAAFGPRLAEADERGSDLSTPGILTDLEPGRSVMNKIIVGFDGTDQARTRFVSVRRWRARRTHG